MRIKCDNPEAVVKEAFWLAWQACGGTTGCGFLQDRQTANKDEVWDRMFNRGDYPSGNDPQLAGNVHNKRGKVYGDYVFGRMMKVGFEWDDVSILVRDTEPRPEYQAWCRTYKTFADLVQAAIANVTKQP